MGQCKHLKKSYITEKCRFFYFFRSMKEIGILKLHFKLLNIHIAHLVDFFEIFFDQWGQKTRFLDYFGKYQLKSLVFCLKLLQPIFLMIFT